LINYTWWVMAGSSMWGAFIEQFVLKGEKFMHLDIAGPAFLKESYGVHGVWATGFGVESLSYLIQNYGKTSQR
jgi:leucyl aminopeptidase